MTGISMNKNNKRVLIAAPVHKVLTEGLEALGYICDAREKITQAEAPGLLTNYEGIITSTRLFLNNELLDAAPILKWIGRMGSGMEIVDVAYAAQKGILCVSSPEGNCNAVGEHALGMLLSLIRRIPLSNAEMKNGIWLRDENRGTELEGKTIAIIGFGHTGRAFAKKLSGFDMNIIYYDKYARLDSITGAVACESLDTVFKEADIVSFHVPYSEETVHYFNDSFLSAMAKPFILINTSRGKVADTTTIYNGIKTGKIIGACLDVFEKEPIAGFSGDKKNYIEELIDAPNVVVTPHIAGYTYEALYKMSKTLLEKISCQIFN